MIGTLQGAHPKIRVDVFLSTHKTLRRTKTNREIHLHRRLMKTLEILLHLHQVQMRILSLLLMILTLMMMMVSTHTDIDHVTVILIVNVENVINIQG